MRKAMTLLLVVFMLALTACTPTATTTAAPTTTPAVTTTAVTTSAATTTVASKTVRLSTTTSVNDTGLLPELEKMFEASSGYQLDIVANGTGAAIKLGETGDADVLLVHAKASEETFINTGFGVKRIPFMYNYFVIAGPKEDPAKVAQTKTAADAFKAIATAKAKFVSRGDDSGTHKAELKIWEAAGIKPAGDWYISAGKGMGPSLIMAGELQAYILTDKGTYLTNEAQTGLTLALSESADLKNTYSLIAVNPQKNPGVNVTGAQAFIDFMLSAEAKAIISQYGKEKFGEPLFIYDYAG